MLNEEKREYYSLTVDGSGRKGGKYISLGGIGGRPPLGKISTEYDFLYIKCRWFVVQVGALRRNNFERIVGERSSKKQF